VNSAQIIHLGTVHVNSAQVKVNSAQVNYSPGTREEAGELFTWQTQEEAALSCFGEPAVSTQKTWVPHK